MQYRMHPDIRYFPSVEFYGGNLVDGESVKSIIPFELSGSNLDIGQFVLSVSLNGFEITPGKPINLQSTTRHDADSPLSPNPLVRRRSLSERAKELNVAFSSPTINLKTLEFFDISSSFEERDRQNQKTLINTQEAVFICGFIQSFREIFHGFSIGVITPYDGQKRLLRRMISEQCSETFQIEVNTVDGFQGREKDIIIMSCVRSSKNGIGFLDDDRRMNVAITRARRCLIIVANAASLHAGGNLSWRNYIEFCKDKKCFNSVVMKVTK